MCDKDWDGVLDVSWQPGFVSRAVAALAQRTRTWVYVSSCSVYAAHDTIGADESADLLPALEGGEATMATYGEAKVACEHAVVEGVDCVEVSAQGTFNVCGPVTRFADHLDVARRVAAHSGPGLSPQEERQLIAVARN